MPGVMRQIGPPFTNNKGIETKPLALIKWCETCGVEGAMFGLTGADGKRLWFCGYENGEPKCNSTRK